MLTLALIILSFVSLLFILFVDMFLSLSDKPAYMTNQGHVNLYIVPFLASFSFFTLALEETVLGVIMLILFTGIYVYILSYDKIILTGAVMDEVIHELEDYLKASGRDYRMRLTLSRTVAFEINNYPNALTVRDAGRWVEIDNHLNYDEAFISALNRHFKKKTKEMTSTRRKPNIFFYILLAVIISLVSFLIVRSM